MVEIATARMAGEVAAFVDDEEVGVVRNDADCEIDRRLAELESGQVESVPGEQVMAEVRKIVGL